MRRSKRQFAGLLAVVALTATIVGAQAPAWWTNRSVINTNAVARDFAPVNQGQVKWLATQAAAEFYEKLQNCGGTGSNIVALLATFTTNNNYRPVNAGQLKNAVAPFYGRLFELGLTNCYPHGAGVPYPWSSAINPPRDFSLVNIGQAKYVFSFNTEVDSDGDGIPDIWEVNIGLNPNNPNDAGQPSANPFAHGISNLQVYQNPSVLLEDGFSSLGDDLPDWWKIGTGYSPTTPGSTVGTNGITLAENYLNNWASPAEITAALDQFNVGQVDQLRSIMNLSPIDWDQTADNSARIAQYRASLESVLVNCLDLTVHGRTFGETNVVVRWTLSTVLQSVGKTSGTWSSGPLTMAHVDELQAVLSQLIRVPSEGSTFYEGIPYLDDEEDAAGWYMMWSVREDQPSQWPTNWLVATYILFSAKDQDGLFLDDCLKLNGAENPHHAYVVGNTEVTADWLPNQTNEVEAWDEAPNTLYCSDFHIVHVLELPGPKVNIAIDGDHNPANNMAFDDPLYQKCTFWVNDDHDVISSGEEDDKNDNVKDCDRETNNTGSKIDCMRDLEDFVRVHLKVDDHTANLPGITYYLKFTNVKAGSPAVNFFEAIDESTAYLTVSDVAGHQIQKQNLTTDGVGRKEVKIDNRYIKAGDQVSPFIIEGRRVGAGNLTFIVKQDGKEIGRKAITLDLHTNKWFYDIFKTDIVAGSDNNQWTVQVQNCTQSNTAQYPAENDEYLLFVHGWNMAEWEKERWAETAFKRLWWQGYKGKLGLFSWPTEYDMTWWNSAWNTHHFDTSELRAWLCSDNLTNCFAALNGNGTLRVLAHSMGNVVAGEALRKYSGNALTTYIAAQAALSANSYDIAEIIPGIQQWYVLVPPYYGISTPNIIGHYHSGTTTDSPYFAADTLKANTWHNYFNVGDYALRGIHWELDAVSRPDNWLPLFFDYEGSVTNYNETNDHFFRWLNPDHDNLSVAVDRQRYEVFSYCEQSRVVALGCVDPTGWQSSLDLTDAPLGYNDAHYSHSREFRSNIVDEKAYWDRVWQDCDFSR